MRNALDHPFLFAIVMTVIVFGFGHLFHMAAKHLNQEAIAAYFAANN